LGDNFEGRQVGGFSPRFILQAEDFQDAVLSAIGFPE